MSRLDASVYDAPISPGFYITENEFAEKWSQAVLQGSSQASSQLQKELEEVRRELAAIKQNKTPVDDTRVKALEETVNNHKQRFADEDTMEQRIVRKFVNECCHQVNNGKCEVGRFSNALWSYSMKMGRPIPRDKVKNLMEHVAPNNEWYKGHRETFYRGIDLKPVPDFSSRSPASSASSSPAGLPNLGTASPASYTSPPGSSIGYVASRTPPTLSTK